METFSAQQPAFDTVTEALTWLKVVGYTHDLNLNPSESFDASSGAPENFQVNHVFRFDGNSDSEGDCTIYAVSSEIHKIKGIVISKFGKFNVPISEGMIQKLTVRN